MKTLLNPSDQKEIVRRLQTISPTTQRKWGKMSAHQMVCHLSDGYRMFVGEKLVPPAPVSIPPVLLKWAALWIPIPWPKGFKAAPELDQHIGGTPGGSIAAAVYALNPPLRRCPPPNELPAVDPFAVRQVKGRLKRLADGAYGRKYRDTLAKKKARLHMQGRALLSGSDVCYLSVDVLHLLLSG